MFTAIKQLFDESSPNLKARIITIYVILAIINIGAWVWAFIAFYDKPTLLGVSLVIYGLGLRHAVDADHIAAIDNVTRKLMQMNQRPVTVGFFFAMGHSTVVFIAATLVAIAANTLNSFGKFQSVSGIIGTLVSSTFLLAIAIMNIFIFISIYKTYKRVKAGGKYAEEDLDILLNNRGFLSRLFRPMFKLVTKGWHMFPLGFLFGLGFDTATEVSMFGVSAAQASQGVPMTSILVFPVLFAAGMSLVDTSDGIMMLKAYDWAFVKPMRKLFYNMSITLVSIIVAIFIGGIEALALLADQLQLTGFFWDVISDLGNNFNDLGYAIIGLFILAWLISYVIYKKQNIE
ncbi:HoxN/HupN/NixA family nickel/cobalt transporter [Commensalibacter nepenthis]|uniref:Nickel/cobalt efflux system n=1 Tax=Commensalibacter nepenthis TaxID=3043872 RepID=A0ABT6Q8N7_9PROT|nr:HoxN/HupN/NixA family nickel/cobalt transporter [Commensalibacter sp. TBRC 10068]MDI2112608.1 HoxN/HupN/NixA family nickel/cobalt transporter [Commensalibacter sp. TBRC 10068]